MDKKSILIRQAARLPVQMRREIVDGIVESIKRDESAVDALTRFAQLVRVAEAVFGTVYNPDRQYPADAYVRTVCAWEMRREGYTLSQIGRSMGRNTSSIVAMDHRGNDMLEGFLGTDAKNKFNQFLQTI